MASSVIVDVFVSVDGWAGSDGLPAYFGYPGPELQEWITAESGAPQVAILGRRTYEALAGLPEEARDDGWHRLSRLEKVIFSRTLTSTDWPNTRICARDLVDEVRGMKDAGSVPLRTVGSLSVARQLLAGGLVDRLRLMVFPLVAGTAGRQAAFDGAIPADLDLVGHRALDGRVLLVEYRPTGRDVPRSQ